jgi:acyl-coenzyme A thioesterase PaaI-like protein
MTESAFGEAELNLIRGKDGGVVMCVACRRLGRCRLGLTGETLVEFGSTVTRLSCLSDHEGGPGVAHGGWTAAALDEILGHLVILSGHMAVTGSLTVEFLKPVPIERELEVRAWLERREDGRWHNVGELRLISTGALLARATGIFVERNPTAHFERQKRWLADQDRLTGGD